MLRTILVITIIFTAIAAYAGGGQQPNHRTTQQPNHRTTRQVSFRNDIIPILTRIGCNQGECHGSQFGKGGFKLSLAGFDPETDYVKIVKEKGGRRASIAEPARSLILLKPTLTVAHGGGLRLKRGSTDYETISRWLAQGAPPPKPDDRVVSKLEVFPSLTITRKGDPKQLLTVKATYSDRSTRVVTSWARMNSLDDGVVTCTPEGVVTPVGHGQTSVMVRYGGQVTVSTFVVPYVWRNVDARATGDTEPRSIDSIVARKHQQLGLVPSPICDDAIFVRRVFFDLIGTSPTTKELAAFIADKSSNKRDRLVDTLLKRPEYADYWSLKWGDLLRCNRNSLTQKGVVCFSEWIHQQFEVNRPASQMVRDLIMAKGSTFTEGPANFYRVATAAEDLGETASQIFLGVRLQCAKCHQHPFEKWSQTDYYQFAAFFARVSLKSSEDFGIFGNDQILRVNDSGDVSHPRTGALMSPTALGVNVPKKRPDPDAGGDRRKVLTDWLTGGGSRLLARNLVNRYWGYLFGKGIVNPIDDLRVTNPPTNPELLDFLTDELVRSKFDLKHILRLICTSESYQRSSETTERNKADELFFTHYIPRRLPAETLLDAVDYACGTKEKYPGMPLGTRAIQLPDPGVASDFLDIFGRPQRLTTCECERIVEPNLSQILRMMNGQIVHGKVTSEDGRVSKLINAKKSNNEILDELYLVTFARPPRAKERQDLQRIIATSKDRKAVFEDILLTLLNSKEFLLNH